jgi:signal transduction histidine kinase
VGSPLEPPLAEAVTGQDVLSRLAWLWHALFGVTLAIPTVLAVTSATQPAGRKALVVGLVAAIGLLHWLVVARHPQWWQERIAGLAAYWAGMCVLLTALAWFESHFTLALYGQFPLMIMTLGWWGMAPVAGLTASMLWAVGGWESPQDVLGSVLSTAGLAAVITFFLEMISRQSEQRREAVAQLAATRAELAEASRRAGMVAERERLSRELHDTIAQGFISVVTQLESAEQALDDPAGIAQARRRVETARRTARTSLEEVRRSVRALRPDLLESSSLPAALAQLARRWSTETGVSADFGATGNPVPLRPDAELSLLRIAQEALSNVARHAAASRVVVTLSYLGDTVTLDVDDDGVGFDGQLGLQVDGGFGLLGMRERIEAIGGALAVESVPGRGTTIAASVPA